jgi:hypothetical protein
MENTKMKRERKKRISKERISKECLEDKDKNKDKLMDEMIDEMLEKEMLEKEMLEKEMLENHVIDPNIYNILSPYLPFIHSDFHTLFLNFPTQYLHDPQFIHFHIFTIWFFSQFHISPPYNFHHFYKNHFSLFPFVTSTFHIKHTLQ